MHNERLIVDIETYDPELSEMGSGVYRKDGYVLGVALYDPQTKYKRYVNLRHKGITESEKAENMRYLENILATNSIKVGANFLYDLDWLENGEGMNLKVNGKYQDVQSRECLLDAYAGSYSLDTLSKKYGFEGKHDQEIIDWCNARGLKGAPQKYLYMMPFDIAERYALGDVEETDKVFMAQEPEIMGQGLDQILNIEMGLYPLLLQMRRTGIRVNESRRQQVGEELTNEYYETLSRFETKYDCKGININSGSDLLAVFNKHGIPVIYTAKGNPSFSKESLSLVGHEITSDIEEIRGYKTVINNFVNGSLLDYQVNGRIYANFQPMRSDDHGTVTGRFACLNPNLQQIPAKKEKHGPLIRDILIPEEGCWYGAPDYSQIEYRILMHFASGPGADEVRKMFINDATTDYHQVVVDMTGLDRKHAKNFNFGSIYCMGKDTMRKKFGFSVEQCEALTEQYYTMMPFIKPTRNAIINTAKRRGFLRTVLGRRARVSQEIKEHGAEYKLVNYLIQGSAADVMKKGMYDAYNAGVFNVLTPHITVHDELGVSVPQTVEGIEAYQELVDIMENCIKIDVPLHVDCDLGYSFGNLKENVSLDATMQNIKKGILEIATFQE